MQSLASALRCVGDYTGSSAADDAWYIWGGSGCAGGGGGCGCGCGVDGPCYSWLVVFAGADAGGGVGQCGGHRAGVFSCAVLPAGFPPGGGCVLFPPASWCPPRLWLRRLLCLSFHRRPHECRLSLAAAKVGADTIRGNYLEPAQEPSLWEPTSIPRAIYVTPGIVVHESF